MFTLDNNWCELTKIDIIALSLPALHQKGFFFIFQMTRFDIIFLIVHLSACYFLKWEYISPFAFNGSNKNRNQIMQQPITRHFTDVSGLVAVLSKARLVVLMYVCNYSQYDDVSTLDRLSLEII